MSAPTWEAEAVQVAALRWKGSKLNYWRALEHHHSDSPAVGTAEELLSDAEMSLVEAVRAWEEREGIGGDDYPQPAP